MKNIGIVLRKVRYGSLLLRIIHLLRLAFCVKVATIMEAVPEGDLWKTGKHLLVRPSVTFGPWWTLQRSSFLSTDRNSRTQWELGLVIVQWRAIMLGILSNL